MTGSSESGIRVLHVDDEPDFAEMAAEFLERADDRLSVTSETSASDGLDRVEAAEFDCVVSDYDLPALDGIEFLDRIRETHPTLPFVLFTGKGSEEVASEAISEGVTEYMQKGGGTEQYEVLANRVINSVEQYRAEREAEVTRRRLEELTESTSDCLWMFDSDWETLLFISGYEAVWGRPADAIEDDPSDFLNGVHPDDREFVRSVMDRLSDGEAIDVEYRILTPDDDLRWVWVKGKPIFEAGEVARVVGFTRDVTDRTERERELEAIIENAESAIYIKDREGVYQQANSTFADIADMALDDLIGAHVTDVFDAEGAAQSLETDRDVIADGEPVSEEVVRTMAGEERVFLSNKFPYRDSEGTIVGVVGLSRDITERKERERALQQRNERLDEFASLVSHDLRNPLNVATGQLSLARDERDGEHLRSVASALSRMEALIDDLLTLARGREPVDAESVVDLQTVADRCFEHVQTDGASLVVDTDCCIRADAARLERLLENLLRNAVEHGGDGVTVTVGEVDDGFYVADDGRGIPDGVREKVFEPGYSTATEGTGFGLAIVADLAEAHGWEVSVTDSDAGGARFEFRGVSTDAPDATGSV